VDLRRAHSLDVLVVERRGLDDAEELRPTRRRPGRRRRGEEQREQTKRQCNPAHTSPALVGQSLHIHPG
jgi:hypothetical protein